MADGHGLKKLACPLFRHKITSIQRKIYLFMLSQLTHKTWLNDTHHGVKPKYLPSYAGYLTPVKAPATWKTTLLSQRGKHLLIFGNEDWLDFIRKNPIRPSKFCPITPEHRWESLQFSFFGQPCPNSLIYIHLFSRCYLFLVYSLK